VSVTDLTWIEVVPVFEMVTACDGLVVPSDWLAKVKDVVFRVATAVVLVPRPVRLTFVAGETSKVRVPVKLFAESEEKVTLKFAHAP
jgi:hypothetical protein